MTAEALPVRAQHPPGVRVMASRPAARSGARWVWHRGAPGLTLRSPADWSVVAQGPEGLTVRDPAGTAAALVRRRDVPPEADLADWLWQRYPATEPGLHQVQMRRVETLPAQAACAVFDYGSQLARGRASALAVRHGREVTVFVAAAEIDRHRCALPELLHVLSSCCPCATHHGAAACRALLARLQRLSADVQDR